MNDYRKKTRFSANFQITATPTLTSDATVCRSTGSHGHSGQELEGSLERHASNKSLLRFSSPVKLSITSLRMGIVVRQWYWNFSHDDENNSCFPKLFNLFFGLRARKASISRVFTLPGKTPSENASKLTISTSLRPKLQVFGVNQTGFWKAIEDFFQVNKVFFKSGKT